MKKSFSDKVQVCLKWTVPFLIFFSIFYSIVESNKTSEIIFINSEKDETEILSELKKTGLVSNISYALASIAVQLGLEIEPGGFNITRNSGPISFLAAVSEPEFKYISIEEGLRKEEISEIFTKELNWTEEEENIFINDLPLCLFTGSEGYLFPGTYLVHKKEGPKNIRKRMELKLFENISELTKSSEEETEDILNTRQILIIASLIQREAGGKEDMKLISGVIWNRLFREMPLQIDATLQYAKANEEIGWWPPIYSKDKFLDSPYNTYQNKGLTPGPIASPGKDAIEAAINPTDTTCIYYIHDKSRNIHCSSSYEKHKQNISWYLK
jgi:UPF0755 protein